MPFKLRRLQVSCERFGVVLLNSRHAGRAWKDY